MAGVQDDGLHVGRTDSTVHLSLDVVVEVVETGRVGQVDQVLEAVGPPTSVGSNTAGKQNELREATSGRSRRWADPKRIAPPYGRRDGSSAVDLAPAGRGLVVAAVEIRAELSTATVRHPGGR